MHIPLTNLSIGQLLPLVFVTYLAGFLYLLFIRRYDKYEKEPVSKLILFSFFGGIVSVSVATFLYVFIHPKQTFFDAVFLVGSVEEFAKLSSFLILYKFIKKDFDEIVDGIIYIAALSLGFSVIENLFYAMESDYPYKLLAFRFLTATIGHIAFSVYLGIALYIHKKVHKNYLGLGLAFLLSTLAHGFYDGVIFQPELNMFFLPLFLFLIWMSFKLLKLAYAYSKMKHEMDRNSFTPKDKVSLKCCHCGSSQVKEYEFKKLAIYICESCNNLLIETNTFRSLIKYYRPVLNSKSFYKNNFRSGSFYLNPQETIYYHSHKKRINAELSSLKQWFDVENKNDIKKYQKKIPGKIFKYLGLRYL